MTHVFANLGSDHPSILEAMVKGQKEKKDQFPTIITCPNEVSRYILYPATIGTCLTPHLLLTISWWPCPWQMAMLA